MNIFSKKMVKFSSLVLATCLSQNIYAVSTITSPAEIVVVAINDQVLKSSLLKNAKDYKVDPGPTRLSVRYQEYFENGIGQHDIVKSATLNITVPELQDKQNYVLKLLNAPKNYENAKKYSEQPEIAIFDNKNQKIAQHLGWSTQAKGSLLDGLFGNSVDATQAKTSTKQTDLSRLAADNPRSDNSEKQYSKEISNIVPPRSLSSDQQLIQIWQSASKSERQKFMSWLAEQ